MPTLTRTTPLGAVALLVAVTSACGGGGGGGATMGSGGSGQVVSCPITSVPTTPTWSGDIYPLLHSPTCGSSATSCHGGASAQGRLDYSLSSPALYAALVDQPSTTFSVSGWAIIKSNDSAHSWLYEKVAPAIAGEPGKAATGSKTGSQMPLGGTLCTTTTDTLKRWIDQGAQNN
jgi:hypothetical protein